MSIRPRAGLGQEPGARNAIRVSHMAGRHLYSQAASSVPANRKQELGVEPVLEPGHAVQTS